MWKWAEVVWGRAKASQPGTALRSNQHSPSPTTELSAADSGRGRVSEFVRELGRAPHSPWVAASFATYSGSVLQGRNRRGSISGGRNALEQVC